LISVDTTERAGTSDASVVRLIAGRADAGAGVAQCLRQMMEEARGFVVLGVERQHATYAPLAFSR